MIPPGDDVVIRGRQVIIRRKRLSDAVNEYAWRLDEEMARLDASLPVRAPFDAYLRGWTFDLKFTDLGRRSFAIEDEAGNHIGNVMYYNLDKPRREAELGISIGDKTRWGQGYGSDAVAAIVRYVFQQTDTQRLYLHTLNWNTRAQRAFSKAGFAACGTSWREGQTFVVMERWRGSQAVSERAKVALV